MQARDLEMLEMLRVNRMDVTRFIEVKKEIEKNETDLGFSFFTDDVTEDLKYK